MQKPRPQNIDIWPNDGHFYINDIYSGRVAKKLKNESQIELSRKIIKLLNQRHITYKLSSIKL